MTVLLIDPVVRERLRALCVLAQAHPVDMLSLIERLGTEAGKVEHMGAMTAQTVEIPVGFWVTFSIEHNHPCGSARHMSVSVGRADRAPNPHAVWMVAQELGFWGTLEDTTVWPEPLLGHRSVAINVVQPMNKPAQH